MDPNRVIIFDTTLRDGEQSPGISLNATEKLEIAQQLARLGVDVIEAGFPIASPGDFQAVRAIAREVHGPGDRRPGPCPCGRHRARGRGGARRGAPARAHVHLDLGHPHPAPAAVHARGRAGPGPRRRRARPLAGRGRRVQPDGRHPRRRRVHRRGPRRPRSRRARPRSTSRTPSATRCPSEYAAFLGRLYELVPGLHDVVLSVHCHNDLGLAVANSFAGLQAGARQVECAINGLGERAGNASLEEIVMLLRTREADIGFTTGINTREIARASRMVSRLTGYSVQPNKAVVGRNAFQHESGIHQDGVLKERSTYEIMSAASVGLRRRELDRARQALRPPRAAVGADGPGLRGRPARRSTRRSSASRSSRTRRSRSPRWTWRRSSPTSSAPTSCAYTLEWFDVEASTRRPPHATVSIVTPGGRDRARRLHRRRPDRRDLPRDQLRHRAARRACASSASTPSPAARTRSARRA